MARRRIRRRKSSKYGMGSWSAGKKILTVLGGTVVLVITACIVVVAMKLGKVETTKLDPQKLNISKTAQEENQGDVQGYLNVALFGLDSREAELGMGTRSDTIMVASLNKATKEVKISSVFRDTLLEQKDGTYNKANAAYSFGGPEGAVAMLNKNLDLDIQHYVAVNFNALVDVIDLLGGLDINLTEEERIWMNGYAAETAEVVGQDNEDLMQAGVQHLSGVQAVSFARIRYTDGDDFKRAERQRQVLSLIVEKAQKAKLSTINKIIDKVFPEISTNFTLTEILSYAKDAFKYKLGEMTGFPADNTTETLNGVGSTVIPLTLESNVITMHWFLYGEDGYTPSSTVTEISRGVAGKAGDRKTGESSKGNSYDENSESNDNENSNYNENSNENVNNNTGSEKENTGNGGNSSGNNEVDNSTSGDNSTSQDTTGNEE